ncbi:MAG TPA: alpha/beta fold hydrolase [Acidimicrobiales bacterium]
MPRLSSTLDRMQEHYDVVVVGSGYGGAIVAARLAAAGHSVCVLERGRELHPGDFPRTLREAVRQVQLHRRGKRRGARTGLFDLYSGHDLSVLVGCGLGGTSLINAGVALRPPAWVFDDPRWPVELRGDGAQVLEPYLARAEQMLGVSAYPDDWPGLPKYEALGKVAAALGGRVEPAPVAVQFGRRGPGTPDSDAVARPAGAQAQACQLCGDCVTGCNYGAKNTVAVNYLPHAVLHGAQIFTEAEVRTVLPTPPGDRGRGRWTVAFDSLADRRRRFSDAPSLFVRADAVVLAAGALGSTEILFRSRAEGLALSPRLGHGFSGNGDALAFAYDADAPVRGLGLGRRPPASGAEVGPCITGMVRIPDGAGGELLVEEGVVPGALRSVLPAAFAFAAETGGAGRPFTFLARVLRRLRSAPDALQRTLTYLVMGDDRGEGRLTFSGGDSVEVEWPAASDEPVFDRGDDVLERASAALGARLVRNPFDSPAFHDSLITVHPLGGCPMGDDATTGVVDHRGRVFDGAGAPGDVHEGLSVVDGSIVPRPLAVNPLLTISALAERAADLLADDLTTAKEAAAAAAVRPGPEAAPRVEVGGAPAPSEPAALDEPGAPSSTPEPERGPAAPPDVDHTARPPDRSWIDDLAPFLAPRRPAPLPPDPFVPSLRFTERLRGHLAPIGQVASPRDREELVALVLTAAERGRAAGTTVELVLSVGIDDLPALIDDPSRPGTLAGTVVAPLLSPTRLRVVDGRFQLIAEDRAHVDSWLMRYSMRLVAEDGRRFRLTGIKVLHDRAGLDAWGDTTTLYVTVTDDDGPAGGLVAAGVLHLGPGDFARQLSTMRVGGVASRRERLRWLARFDATFLRSLLRVYGGPLDDVADFPAVKPNPVSLTGDGSRKLRLPQPEPRWCDGAGRWHEGNDLGDDAWLRLTRFEGGRRGPVLLAPGFGMSSTSFLLGTTHTNLTEDLVSKGYDVWLFDYRSGIDLPSAHTSFNLDDIATEDWPTAVAEVLRVTGAGSVQAVGHCVGSATLMMALAAGLDGVRSAVCMQFTLHMATSLLNQTKAALGIPRLAAGIGLSKIGPLRGRTVGNTALDLALRAVPMPTDERCGQAVCRWVNAIYGCTHRHEQLDDATHELLPELFGVGNVEAFQHFADITRRRGVFDAAGADVYRAHPERLRLPILIIQGRHNRIFHPEGSLRTLRWLQQANDPSLYERVVLQDYAHLDALIGRNAARDVYPVITGHLQRFNA